MAMSARTKSTRAGLILKLAPTLFLCVALGACSQAPYAQRDGLERQHRDTWIIQKEAQETAMAWLLAHFKGEDEGTPRSHNIEATWEAVRPVVFYRGGRYLPGYRLDGKVTHWPSFSNKEPMDYHFTFIDGKIVKTWGGPKPPKGVPMY